MIAGIAHKAKAPVVYCNTVGANDQLIFDGHSLVAGTNGRIAVQFPGFSEQCRVVDPFLSVDDDVELDEKAAKKNLRPVTLEPLKDIANRFAAFDDWDAEKITNEIRECAEAHGINMGKLGQPLRVAVTGGGVSPPIDVTLGLVGKERTLARIGKAIEYVEARAAAA